MDDYFTFLFNVLVISFGDNIEDLLTYYIIKKTKVIEYCKSQIIPTFEKNIVPYTTYDKELADALLEMSLGVTYSNCLKENSLIHNDFPNIYTIKNERTNERYGCIFYNAKTLVIVFTGSFHPSHWVNDMKFMQVAPENIIGYKKNMLVHKGFYEIYSNIRKSIWKIWIENCSTVTSLIITGHSLGGALSSLCTIDFSSFIPIHYSFASPRVGNEIYATEFKNRVKCSYRLYNTEDIVSSLPPPHIGGFHYEHSGESIGFTISGKDYRETHVNAFMKYFEVSSSISI